MPFRFALDTLLRYRRGLEEQERLRLQALLARRAEKQAEIGRLKGALLALSSSLLLSMEKADVPAGELQFASLQNNAAQSAVAGLQLQIQCLQKEIEVQRERYSNERRRSELLQSLRDVQWREYQLLERRREQASLDEVHLLRNPNRRPEFAQ